MTRRGGQPGYQGDRGQHVQPERRRARGQLGAGDGQRGFERRSREVGQLRGDLVQRDQPGEIPGRQLDQAAAVSGPQRGGRITAASSLGPRHWLRVSRLGPGGLQQGGAQLCRGEPAQRVLAAKHLPVIRMPGQMLAQRSAGPQHGGQPGAQPRIVTQPAAQLSVDGHPGQRGQREIRVGGRGERGQQASVGAIGIKGEILGHQQLRAAGISETHPGQAAGWGGSAQHAHSCTVAGTRGAAQTGRPPNRR